MKSLIVITGASSGIGEATARAFSEAGHPLLLLSRRVEKMEALGLRNALCESVDVMDREAFSAAVAKAEAKYGPVDGLVNCAGVMLLGLMHEQDPEEWHSMLQVNVLGLMHGIHAVLKPMIGRKRGTIINISSIAGRKTFPNHAAYCGTKFAVHAISENLREEVCEHDVRVVTIAPGAVETALLSHTSSESIKADYEAWKKEIGGALSPEDVARSVLFTYEQPQSVCIREVVIAATKQAP